MFYDSDFNSNSDSEKRMQRPRVSSTDFYKILPKLSKFSYFMKFYLLVKFQHFLIVFGYCAPNPYKPRSKVVPKKVISAQTHTMLARKADEMRYHGNIAYANTNESFSMRNTTGNFLCLVSPSSQKSISEIKLNVLMMITCCVSRRLLCVCCMKR